MTKLTRILASAPLVVLLGCGGISPEPLGDYTSWKRVDATGPAPGHGTTYRVIYINDLAADPTQDFYLGYQLGSVIVKEIRDDDDGMPGALRYVAIMRRDREIATSGEEEGGWLFSRAETPGGEEKYQGLCWGRCHAAAPYNGAWYDYRK